MGRRVYEINVGYKPVWKYIFGRQDSEQMRVAFEIGGKVFPATEEMFGLLESEGSEYVYNNIDVHINTEDADADILLLNRETDIPLIHEWLERKNVKERIKEYETYSEQFFKNISTKEGKELKTMSIEDQELVDKWIDMNDKDIYFVMMVSRFQEFMQNHPETDYFVFLGEY